MSPVVCWFLDAGNNERPARSTGRRPKSAKARSRGRLGRDDAASYGWLPGLIRSQSTKFLHDRLVVWHNFSVVARSLLKGTINLGLPWDFNELHVAKISLFATSAITAGKQPLYCMGPSRPLRIGGSRFNLVYTIVYSWYLRCRDPIKPLLRENIF